MNSPSPKKWSIYLLYSRSAKVSYVGATVDISRRIRQHRGEIKGGARATSRADDWQVIAVVSGFRNKVEALRWEALVKRRVRGKAQRLAAFEDLTKGVCPKRGIVYRVPAKLTISYGGS